MVEIKGKYTNAQIMIDDFEDGIIDQLYSIINSPESKGLKVVLMPDVHIGVTVCVGFTMELGKMINPGLCGVDISCGLLSAKFSKNTKLNLEKLESEIREVIPTGFNIHKQAVITKLDFDAIQEMANNFVEKYNMKFNTNYTSPNINDKWLSNRLKEIKMDEKKFWCSISTMGSSNHFIELGKSNIDGDYWITVHSGSRNLGVKVANYWTDVANNIISDDYKKELNDIVLNTYPKSDIPEKIKDLKNKYSINKGFLYGENMINYFFDMILCYHYAHTSRLGILNLIKNKIGISNYDEMISTVHNYVDMDDMIIRKGSVSSYKDKKFLLPFNMRDGILILEGKSNPDWNYSCCHGSGRLFSRTKAKEIVDLDEFKKSMKGIYSTSVNIETLDESPFAYKDSSLIEKLIYPTATIIERIKPILNIKDKSTGESWKEKREKKKKDIKRKLERKLKNGKN